ncbi:hypothetical protein N7495_004056 [Penicillium taxi]|uniref:uncharacterized protein n=1 Tax=Penicillium taxi TaxID=168475 RepID=UPI002545B0C3|nr:uncharacterized protein N7495_004056 [Penicillium taxi]KAJ5899312.1 hypothetical protein N7495_004056 [Penicillium taxi]
MSCNADSIPWDLLTSHLRWAPGKATQQIRDLGPPELPGKLKESEGCGCGVTNLHPILDWRETPEQNEFTNAFAEAVTEASKKKRTQYPNKYSIPSPDDIIISEKLVKEIESHMAGLYDGFRADQDDPLGQWPPIPFQQRTVFAFLHPRDGGDTCFNFYEHNQIGFPNLEIVKMLLMLGELDPILRACAHPDQGLSAYIGLNVALRFPEMWDTTAGKTDETDYRHTGFYQCTLQNCTRSVCFCSSMATSYPHQKFFGIPDKHFSESGNVSIDENHWLCRTDMFNKSGSSRLHSHVGILLFDEFLNLEHALPENTPYSYQPETSDVIFVKQVLRSYLPLELVLDIMDLADYKVKIRHDPLHPANRTELKKYLDLCWQLVIGCDILNNELGMEPIDWQGLVLQEVVHLFYNSFHPRWKEEYAFGTKCTNSQL